LNKQLSSLILSLMPMSNRHWGDGSFFPDSNFSN
jgi:hypothetical protein